MLAACRDLAEQAARDPQLPAALFDWTAPLFDGEAPEAVRLRQAACLLSDVGSRDHPEYRAEQTFLRVLRQSSVALDHHGRAFLALTVAIRYEADPASAMLLPARKLLDEAAGCPGRRSWAMPCGSPTRCRRARRSCWLVQRCGA